LAQHLEHQSASRNDYGRLIAAILLLCLLAAAGYALQHTLSCFLLSWVIAYLLDPLLMQAERRGLNRLFALGFLYVVLSILLTFFFAFMLPKLTISWNGILGELPVYIQKTKQAVLVWKSRLPDRYGTEEIQWLLDTVSANLDTFAEKVGSWVYVFASRILFNIFNIVLSPVLVFFMLYYKQTILETAASLIPEQQRDMVLVIGREVNTSIGGYLRGQVVVSVIVAVLSLTALFILNVPNPIICGLFSGAASVLPFIGVFIAALPALFFAWFKYQTVAGLVQVAIAYGVIYFLEGYVIKPLVFKSSMNLNPLMTIVMVMALGELLGFWGILLALPIAATIKITLVHLHGNNFRD